MQVDTGDIGGTSRGARVVLLGGLIGLASAGLVACDSEPEPYVACRQAENESAASASVTLLLTGAADGKLEPCG